MQQFKDDDDGYLGWAARHPDQYVLNAARNPSPAYLMLHRATCGTVTGTPARGSQWTGDYIKFCGSRRELEDYARDRVGGQVQPCRLCP